MEARLNYAGNAMAMKLVKYINSAGKVLHDSSLPAATQERAASPTRPGRTRPNTTTRTSSSRWSGSSG